MFDSSEVLRHQICNVLIGRDIVEGNGLLQHLLADVMVAEVDVLESAPGGLILGQSDCALIIHLEGSRAILGIANLVEEFAEPYDLSCGGLKCTRLQRMKVNLTSGGGIASESGRIQGKWPCRR